MDSRIFTECLRHARFLGTYINSGKENEGGARNKVAEQEESQRYFGRTELRDFC